MRLIKLKKPYIKKFSKIANFSVWIVDGKYIRDNIDEEFTNYGQYYRFPFIPKNEFWIDKERVPGEEKYYIESMLTMNELLANGISHSEAVRISDAVERRERSKSKLLKKEIKLDKQKDELIKKVHKRLLKEFSENVKVWVVDGELVRGLFFIDFTEGGHGKVYPFIPSDEVWIDNDVDEKEMKFILLHELHERNLMAKGMEYDKAHKKSSELELACRKNPRKLKSKLKEEVKKNSEVF